MIFNKSISQKNIFSKFCILLIAVYWVCSFSYYKRWTKNPVVWDVVSYYAYVPAVFIYDDISLRFTDKDPSFFGMKFWPEHAPNGGKVIKTSMGVSFFYTPFFLLGHLYAKLSGAPQDGFSVPYQVFVQTGTLFYLIVGFIFLRKFLLKYFPDPIVAITIITIFFGTNLLYYSTKEALMAHAYLFSISCIFIFITEKWHRSPDKKTSVLLGLTAGLLTIIKPTMILCVLFPLLFGITGVSAIKEKFILFKKNFSKLFLIIIFFILPGIPQLLYWKYITGHWFYFSYTGEKFFWNNPHVLQGWFSYRNGWLLYTPIMSFALFGFFLMKGKVKQMLLPILIFFLSTVYVIHCWWCWWHGGYGLRAYIELYGVLSVPLASFYNFFLQKKLLTKSFVSVAAILLIALNIFQEWQYEHALISCGSMTKKSYWLSFLKTKVNGTFWQCLQESDVVNAKKGLQEYQDDNNAQHDVIKEISFEDVPKNKDSIYFSSALASKGKHSFILEKQNSFSPAIEMSGGEIQQDTSIGKREASVKFYIENDIKDREGMLVVSFKSDSGTYYYNSMDFYAFDFEPQKWNTAYAEIPVNEIKNKSDRIKIYVWTPEIKDKIFIDELKYEIVR